MEIQIRRESVEGNGREKQVFVGKGWRIRAWHGKSTAPFSHPRGPCPPTGRPNYPSSRWWWSESGVFTTSLASKSLKIRFQRLEADCSIKLCIFYKENRKRRSSWKEEYV